MSARTCRRSRPGLSRCLRCKRSSRSSLRCSSCDGRRWAWRRCAALLMYNDLRRENFLEVLCLSSLTRDGRLGQLFGPSVSFFFCLYSFLISSSLFLSLSLSLPFSLFFFLTEVGTDWLLWELWTSLNRSRKSHPYGNPLSQGSVAWRVIMVGAVVQMSAELTVQGQQLQQSGTATCSRS